MAPQQQQLSPNETLDEALFDRYLSLLGLKRKTPSLTALTEIVQAHLWNVPFENISKLYYKARFGLLELVTLERYLEGIERYHFGGTCYSNNFYLYRLLVHLGYDARLCGADMTNPDVHLTCIVNLEGCEYLVDGGYGAPFFKPMPRDLNTDYVVRLGNESYVLKPQDERGRSQMLHLRNGERIHGYQVKPQPRQIGEFWEVIAQSFLPESTFMNRSMVARFRPGLAQSARNLRWYETTLQGTSIQPLADRNALVERIEVQFGMPAQVVNIALDELGNEWPNNAAAID